MGHFKDIAIDEMNARKMNEFDEMGIENSSWFKVGYMESAIRTAINFLERGQVEQALTQLRNDAVVMGVKNAGR